jgi:hypothetical protein
MHGTRGRRAFGALGVAGLVTIASLGTTGAVSASTLPPKLLYAGTRAATIGGSVRPIARLSRTTADCVANQPVAFSIDRDPTSGTVGSYALETALTSSVGRAAGALISTQGWQTGVYTLTSTLADSASCVGATDDTPIVLALRGDTAWGGGLYAVTNMGHVGFAFRAHQLSNGAFTGSIGFVNKHRWWLSGRVTSYTNTAPGAGSVTGTGALSWFKLSANGWQLASSSVSYTATFTANATGVPATFGIDIVYTPHSGQGALPNTAPQSVLQGAVHVA